jgi:hypothetical protein
MIWTLDFFLAHQSKALWHCAWCFYELDDNFIVGYAFIWNLPQDGIVKPSINGCSVSGPSALHLGADAERTRKINREIGAEMPAYVVEGATMTCAGKSCSWSRVTQSKKDDTGHISGC